MSYFADHLACNKELPKNSRHNQPPLITKCTKCKTANGIIILIWLIISKHHKLLLLNKIWQDHMDKDLINNLDQFHKHNKELSQDMQKTNLATVMLQNQKFCTKETQIKKDPRLEVNQQISGLDLTSKLHPKLVVLEVDLINSQLWAKITWPDLMKQFLKEDQNLRLDHKLVVFQQLKVDKFLSSQLRVNNKRKWKFIKQLKS